MTVARQKHYNAFTAYGPFCWIPPRETSLRSHLGHATANNVARIFAYCTTLQCHCTCRYLNKNLLSQKQLGH